MVTALRIFWRLLAWPFVACLMFIGAMRDLLWLNYLWLRWGGEMIAHKDDPKGIHDVYRRVDEHFKSIPKP